VLSNAEKRNMYDQVGKQGLNGGGMPGGGGGAAFSRDQAEAIFAQMFGGQDPFAGLFGEMGGAGGMGGGRGRAGMGGGPQVQFQFGGEHSLTAIQHPPAPARHRQQKLVSS
jgi:DnaJ-class molecular chaperone